jgi:hypothetical protein
MTVPHPPSRPNVTNQQTSNWRAHESGRVTHLIVGGAAICGEPGMNWRAVAGVSRCPRCQSAGADQHNPGVA